MQLPHPGEQFEGAYQLNEVLGEGGFAVVFGATELGIGRRNVAIKILTPQKNGRYPHDIEARFIREVSILSSLRSPHTVTLFRHGKTDAGLLYLVSEYIPGLDLDAFMRARPLTADDVVEILRQLLDALREAHAAGLMHRDIKPSNIRVHESDGQLHVKLLDFGIARPVLVAPDARLTKTGEMLGTPRYMSPEQLTEEPLTPASDIYSLGIVAYEMLSGGDMHGPRWGDQLDRLGSDHVFSLPELERIGPGLNRVVERMSARRATARFQSAGEVLRALDDLEGGQTLREQPRPTFDDVPDLRRAPTVAENERKDPPAPAIASLLAMLLMMAAAVGYLYWTSEPQEAPADGVRPDSPLTAREPATPAPTRAHVGTPPPPSAAPKASPGCGRPAPFEGTGTLHRMDGLERTDWTVHVPRDYEPQRPHPLVVVFHPGLISPAGIIAHTGFDRLADERHLVVLAPLATSFFTWREENAEGHVHQRIVDTANQLCLDPKRIYLIAHGVGGYAVERLSCEPWVAGAATNSFRRLDMPFCDPAGPVPFLHFAPMDSKRIPPEGGKGCQPLSIKPPLVDFEELWRTRNACAASRHEWKREGEHVCWSWDDCEEPFVSCHLRQGHAWAGSGVPDPILPGTCADGPPADFPTTAVIWEFLKDKAISDEATPAW